MSETPEAHLVTLVARLDAVRAATRFLTEEQRKPFDDALTDAMRSSRMMRLLLDHTVVAVAGTQSAGKTLLVRNLYDLDATWLKDDEGRGEYVPILVVEEEGLSAPQGMMVGWATDGQAVEPRPISPDEFRRRVTSWSGDLTLPMLRVPQRYFQQPRCGFLLLPGYEKVTSVNRRWQDLMRLALVASNACVLVTDASRLAMQQDEIVEDIRQDQLAAVEPIIAITKTEHDTDERREELRDAAVMRFAVPRACTVCTGVGAEFVQSWRTTLIDALVRHGGMGEEARARHLQELKVFTRQIDSIIAQAGTAVRAATRRDADDEEFCEELLRHLEEASHDLRVDYADMLVEALSPARSGARNFAIERYNAEETTYSSIGRSLLEFFTRDVASSDTRMGERVRDSLAKAGVGHAFAERHAELLDRVASKALRVRSLSTPAGDAALPSSEGEQDLVERQATGRITPEVANTIRELLPRAGDARVVLRGADRERLKEAISVLPAVAAGYMHVMQVGATVAHADLQHDVPDAPDVMGILGDAQQTGERLIGMSRSFAKAMAGLLLVDVGVDGEIDSIPALMKTANSLLFGPSSASVAVSAGTVAEAGAAATGATEVAAGAGAVGAGSMAAAGPWILAGVAAATVAYSVASAVNQHDARNRQHIAGTINAIVDHQEAEHLRRFDDMMIEVRKRLVHQLRSRLGLDEHVGNRFWAVAAIRDLKEARTRFLEAARPLAA